MVRKKATRGFAIQVNPQLLTMLVAMVTLIFALNRPVQAFNSLAASVDKLADVVKRIDMITAKQQEKQEEQGREITRQNAEIDALRERLTRIENKK